MSEQQKKPAAPACLNVKLGADIKPRQKDEVLSSTPGVISVTQTFPDEEDEDLSRMYVVEVDPVQSKDALKNLQDNPAVEYAEHSARRKRIR